MRRPLAVLATGLVATVLVAVPAAAHVSVTPGEAPSGGYARLDFSVPHGCDGESTNEVAVAIPPGAVSIKPEFLVGWDVETEIGPYDEPVELHGEEITEGVVSVTWTAQEGFELPDGQFRTFGLSVKLPEGEPGTQLAFPTVQGCVDGAETAWVTVPEGDEEPEHPAPMVTLTAADGGHGDAGTETEAAVEDVAATEAAATEATATAAASTADDGGLDPLAIAALAIALVALGFGIGNWSAARRR